jgi:hypothetical protein
VISDPEWIIAEFTTLAETFAAKSVGDRADSAACGAERKL